MRPLTLAIEGLRSFRTPVEISFEGREHLAIIGDTGSGKSSILEAMTYALFGRTTFTGQANQEVMNDLSDHMRVTLRFTVAGRTFEATRTLRRAGDRSVGSAKASLTEFGPDGTEMRKIEQVRQVDSWIQEILGLDAKAFLRTVVLPQGQFAQLLVGDDPAARAAILRQVWRTDELSRAGQLADDALPQLSQLVGQVTQALVGTPEDPQAYLDRLQADAERRFGLAKQAHDTHRAASTSRETLKRTDELAAAAESVLKKVGGFDLDGAIATAEEVVRSATAIKTERAAAEDNQDTVRSQLRAVPTDEDGLDHQAIGAAQTFLRTLPSRAEAVVTAAGRARAESDQVEEAERTVAELEEDLQRSDDNLKQRKEARVGLGSAVREAETRLDSSQALLREVRQAANDGRTIQEEAENKAREAESLRQEAAQVRKRDLIQAEQEAKEAEKAFAAAQRRNAAAGASHGLHPGDDCPVCSRPLPREWNPPAAEDLDAARRAHRAAEKTQTAVRDEIQRLATKAEMTNIQATELRQNADRSWQTAVTTAAGLAALLGRDQVDPAALPPDDELLQPLSNAVSVAREQLTVYDKVSERVQEQRTTAFANLSNAQGTLKKTRGAYTRSLKDATDAIRTFRSHLTSLPADLGIDVTLPDNPLEILQITLGDIDAAHRVLDERARELDRRAKLRKQLQQQFDTLGDHIKELDIRWASQVLDVGNKAVATLNNHRDALSEGIGQLNIRDITLPPAASLSAPALLKDITIAFREAAGTVTKRTRALIEKTQQEAGAARKAIARIAAELAILPEGAEVRADQVVECAENRATEADAQALAARRNTEDFTRLVDPLTKLRRISGDLDLTYRVLKDLSAALKPGAFPKWLTLRRSRALLIHASRLLEQMSGERYAFAELGDDNAEWRIIDNDSGLARTPGSLSGGEQFITSLALALGMVEMMARSGGRLESLWLDEGFGSLDRSNLDAAIEALAAVASRGRMVAVISHVRAVADQVSDVLAVTRRATGTQANWLSQHQRAQLATGDLEGETATALSGLLE